MLFSALKAFRNLAYFCSGESWCRDVSHPAEVCLFAFEINCEKTNPRQNQHQSSGSCYLAERSLWIPERTRPDARGAARDKTLSEHRGTMFRAAATGPEGGILLNAWGFSPFDLILRCFLNFVDMVFHLVSHWFHLIAVEFSGIWSSIIFRLRNVVTGFWFELKQPWDCEIRNGLRKPWKHLWVCHFQGHGGA